MTLNACRCLHFSGQQKMWLYLKQYEKQSHYIPLTGRHICYTWWSLQWLWWLLVPISRTYCATGPSISCVDCIFFNGEKYPLHETVSDYCVGFNSNQWSASVIFMSRGKYKYAKLSNRPAKTLMFPVIWWMTAELYFLLFRFALRAVSLEHFVPQKAETLDNTIE